GQKLVEIDRDVIGLALAAPGRDVDHSGDRFQPAQQDPVLNGLEVGDGEAGGPDDAVTEDLADRTRRRDDGLRAVGQWPELRQAVDHHLRGLGVGEVVGELDLYVRQA